MRPRAAGTLPVLALAFCFAAEPAGAAVEDVLLRDHLWRQVTSLPKTQRPRVGLVLSAGGIRGLAHVGVIQVLEDAGFPIDLVSGVSMGAVVGGLYAAGISLDRMWGIRDMIRLDTGSDYNSVRLIRLLLTDHLLSTKNMEKVLRDAMGDLQFHQLAKPFACVAMDIKTGEPIIFREGPLAPAVRASMNLPGLFAPVEYRHRYLVDGGVVDYVPVDVAQLMGSEWTLASVTEGDYTKTNPTSVLAALEQVIDIRGALLSRQQRTLADVVIEPAVGDVLFYQTERAGEIMEQGVRAAARDLPRAQDSLILKTLPRLWKRWVR